MTDEQTPKTPETPMTEEQTAEPAGPAADTSAAAPETVPETPAEAAPAAEPDLAAELAAAKDRCLRMMADMDNMRKRQIRELEERTARANERLLQNLMPVYDNFEMALSSATEDSPIVQGVRMIADQFRKVLEQSGAEAIDVQAGAAFDPMAHEALSSVPHPELPQGSVVTQFRKGWRLGGKVIRPAQVVVSAGAPAAPAEEA